MDYIIIFLLIVVIILQLQKNPQPAQAVQTTGYWKSYGIELTILGHKFKNDGTNIYVSEDGVYGFGTYIGDTGTSNHYVIMPNIPITQDQFMSKINPIKE